MNYAIRYVLGKLAQSVFNCVSFTKIISDKLYKNYLFAYFDCKKVQYNKSLTSITGQPAVDFHSGCNVTIGDNFILRSSPDGIGNQKGCHIVVHSNSKLAIGKNSGLSNVVLHCFNSISIGNYVNVGDGCMIFDSNFHSTDWRIRRQREIDETNAITAPVVIEDDVFIGARSIICKGVRIGEKSMIAVGSIVTRDIPAGELWGGVPAKFIRKIENE